MFNRREKNPSYTLNPQKGVVSILNIYDAAMAILHYLYSYGITSAGLWPSEVMLKSRNLKPLFKKMRNGSVSNPLILKGLIFSINIADSKNLPHG